MRRGRRLAGSLHRVRLRRGLERPLAAAGRGRANDQEEDRRPAEISCEIDVHRESPLSMNVSPRSCECFAKVPRQRQSFLAIQSSLAIEVKRASSAAKIMRRYGISSPIPSREVRAADRARARPTMAEGAARAKRA